MSETEPDYRAAFLKANEACSVREAAILDLKAERDRLLDTVARVEALADSLCACTPETRHWANCPTRRLRAALTTPTEAKEADR